MPSLSVAEGAQSETFPTSTQQSTVHYNDWPTTAGFEPGEEQQSPIELQVQGSIPIYCLGTLYRNGPGLRTSRKATGEQYEAAHWFDGLAQVHRFEIVPAEDSGSLPRVYYSSRRVLGADTELAASTGKFTFAQPQDPCESIFRKVSTAFKRGWSYDGRKPATDNVNVTPYVGDLGGGVDNDPRDLILTTDANALLRVDGRTLEPRGLLAQSTFHPALKGSTCATHYARDPVSGDIFNYNLEFGYKSTYRVFQVSAETGQTSIIATITDAPPAYIHSLCLTEHFVVLCIWGARFSHYGLKIIYTNNVLDSLGAFDASKPCLWYVIDRTGLGRGVVASFQSPAFFAFHMINAYECASTTQPGETDIVVDLPCYDDISILTRLYYDNVQSSSPSALKYTLSGEQGQAVRAWHSQWRLPAVTAKTASNERRQADLLWRAPRMDSLELPSIHPRLVGKPHRYVYGVVDRGNSTFFDGIGKLDCLERKTTVWAVKGHTPSEPVFVPDPAAGEEDEDAGVLLSVVLNGYQETSYLLLLDAKTLEEVGRVETGRPIHHGFHGVHAPRKK